MFLPDNSVFEQIYKLFSIATCLLLVALIVIPIYRITFHPLAKYPGPISWSTSRIPWHISLHRGRLHADIYRLHQQYGDVVRIAPNELSYTHPDAYRDILITKPDRPLIPRNGIWFRQPKKLGNVASIMAENEADHARLRRAFASAFTESGVREMAPVVSKHVKLMIRQLEKVVDQSDDESGAVVDLVEWMNFTTFDISGELSFGEGFGSIEAGQAHPWVKINYLFGKGMAMNVSMNFLSPLNQVLAWVVPENIKAKFKYHMELTVERVGKRLEEGQGRPDFLGAIERYNKDNETKGLAEKIISRKELNLNMSIFVFAGSETSSTALSAIVRYLLQNSPEMKKATKEIRDRFKSLSDITPAIIGELGYVDAVIQESMRLGPPVAIAVPRIMPSGGGEICGRFVPEGTLVSVAAYASNRSPRNFQHPEQFIPERFLPNSKLSKDKLDTFQPFSIGRHVCIGYRLALLMMRMILVNLLYTFEIEILREMNDFGQQKSFVIWEKEPLMVRLKKRD